VAAIESFVSTGSARRRTGNGIESGETLRPGGQRRPLPTAKILQTLTPCRVALAQRPRQFRPRAERLLTDLGLWERRGEPVGSYSRGIQQKVAIAAALITDPPILLLHEPTIGLDVEAARTVRDWIAHWPPTRARRLC